MLSTDQFVPEGSLRRPIQTNRNKLEKSMKVTKNIFLSAALLATMVSPVAAQTPTYESFINGTQLILPWAPAAGSTTNLFVGATWNGNPLTNMVFVKSFYQTNSTTYPPVSGNAPLWTIGNGLSDVGLWVNRDGSVPSVAFNFVATDNAITNGVSTNNIVITLTSYAYYKGASVDGGLPGIYSQLNTAAQNTWTFTVTNTAASTNAAGYDLWAISTNLPTSFLQGAFALSLKLTTKDQGCNTGVSFTNYSGSYNSVSNAWSQTNINAGIQIISAGITGWKPSVAN